MRSIKLTTTTLNDSILNQAAKELKVNKDFVEIEVIEEKKSILGLNKSYIVEAKIKFDPMKEGINYLKAILTSMNIEAIVEAKMETERNLSFFVDASENSILIGRNGRTLLAIQTLIKNFINLYLEDYINVVVDIGGYKSQRKKQLEILATKTAKEVAITKIPATLMIMNSYERRIIHTKLSDWRDVETVSEGDEPNRYVIIRPKKRHND